MRSALDFSPLFRSTVGFDRLPRLLEAAAQVDEATLGYPPYDIEKLGDDTYRITMAVAGFGPEELGIETRENTLVVVGRQSAQDDDGSFLHKGIAGRPFQRSFQIADHVKVTGANLENGLLHIELVREVPEAMKPRSIKISTSEPKAISSTAKKVA